MTYILSEKSLNKLEGVHPDLVKVVKYAITISKQDFSVLEGLRTIEAQKANIAKGVSQTMKSKHIKQADGYGHAVDLVPYPLSWNIKYYYAIADAMEKAAKHFNVKIRWGGYWGIFDNTKDENESYLVQRYVDNKKKLKQKAFVDAPHFEIVLN